MKVYVLILLLLFAGIHSEAQPPYVLVLGTAQDGGYPHMGCTKQCCTRAWANDSMRRYVVSLAVVDPEAKRWWLFEATPDIKEQLHYFQQLTRGQYNYLPDGIFITHAHIGHYTGLMELGKEVMNTKSVPVFVLPRMKSFLEKNGPWSQLIAQQNIWVIQIAADSSISFSGNGAYSNEIKVVPFTVPHRDEFSETAGFKISLISKRIILNPDSGKATYINKIKEVQKITTKYLFIPDINKWGLWNKNIADEVKSVDIALLDGTFYDSTELPGRNMKEVPHPLVTETMGLFSSADSATKSKIYFIHLNHTNPLLWDPEKQNLVHKAGFNYAKQGQKLIVNY